MSLSRTQWMLSRMRSETLPCWRKKTREKDIDTKAEITLITELSSAPCDQGETRLEKTYTEKELGSEPWD